MIDDLTQVYSEMTENEPMLAPEYRVRSDEPEMIDYETDSEIEAGIKHKISTLPNSDINQILSLAWDSLNSLLESEDLQEEERQEYTRLRDTVKDVLEQD